MSRGLKPICLIRDFIFEPNLIVINCRRDNSNVDITLFQQFINTEICCSYTANHHHTIRFWSQKGKRKTDFIAFTHIHKPSKKEEFGMGVTNIMCIKCVWLMFFWLRSESIENSYNWFLCPLHNWLRKNYSGCKCSSASVYH